MAGRVASCASLGPNGVDPVRVNCNEIADVPLFLAQRVNGDQQRKMTEGIDATSCLTAARYSDLGPIAPFLGGENSRTLRPGDLESSNDVTDGSSCLPQLTEHFKSDITAALLYCTVLEKKATRR